MTLPAFLFGFLLSTLYGGLFHLLRGGNAGRFLLYLVLAWVGFWSGQVIAALTELTFFSIGPLHLGLASLFSLLTLIIGNWLSQVKTSDTK